MSVDFIQTSHRFYHFWSPYLECECLYLLGLAVVKSMWVRFSTKHEPASLLPIANSTQTLNKTLCLGWILTLWKDLTSRFIEDTIDRYTAFLLHRARIVGVLGYEEFVCASSLTFLQYSKWWNSRRQARIVLPVNATHCFKQFLIYQLLALLDGRRGNQPLPMSYLMESNNHQTLKSMARVYWSNTVIVVILYFSVALQSNKSSSCGWYNLAGFGL